MGPIGRMGHMRASAGSGDCPVMRLSLDEPQNSSGAARPALPQTAVAFVSQHLTFGIPVKCGRHCEPSYGDCTHWSRLAAFFTVLHF
jgi:hypothetical protein